MFLEGGTFQTRFVLCTCCRNYSKTEVKGLLPVTIIPHNRTLTACAAPAPAFSALSKQLHAREQATTSISLNWVNEDVLTVASFTSFEIVS